MWQASSLGDNKKQPVVYKVSFTKRCEHRFKKLQESIKKNIAKVIDDLSVNPLIGYPLRDVLLKGLYSVHAGDFRIVYKFSENPAEIEIWAIEHRSHVYEELMRYRSSAS